jgi:hypothetical protein
MARLWEFLRNEQNRLVLGWIGGGLVVAATGAWAAFIYFYPLHKPPEPPAAPAKAETRPSNVEASCGGIAIGGNVSGGTITAGSPRASDCATKSK